MKRRVEAKGRNEGMGILSLSAQHLLSEACHSLCLRGHTGFFLEKVDGALETSLETSLSRRGSAAWGAGVVPFVFVFLF